jgi:hypothetical protein
MEAPTSCKTKSVAASLVNMLKNLAAIIKSQRGRNTFATASQNGCRLFGYQVGDLTA